MEIRRMAENVPSKENLIRLVIFTWSGAVVDQVAARTDLVAIPKNQTRKAPIGRRWTGQFKFVLAEPSVD